MSAKDAALRRFGSHHVSDEISSQSADGIGKEEVYLYFSAKWRGKPVIVTMSADRYAASFDGVNRLTNWRTYASEARYSDDPNTRSGESVSGTARSALSKLCEPLVTEWLASDAYAASFQVAVAHHIMRQFRDNHSASRRVKDALATFHTRLPRAVYIALLNALDAHEAFEVAKGDAFRAIEGSTPTNRLETE